MVNIIKQEIVIEEFNNIYELDSKLKEKQKGKNKDYTPYERLKFNEKEINKSLKHINDDMEKSAEEFYTTKKEKDDDLSL